MTNNHNSNSKYKSKAVLSRGLSTKNLALILLMLSLCWSCNQHNEKKSSVKEASNTAQSLTDLRDMVYIHAGTYEMGTNDPDFADASPIHKVTVDGFWIDKHEVTNAQFTAFVKATNYVTVAEKPLNPADFPGVPVSALVPGSAVFTMPKHEVPLTDPNQWWKYIPGTNWKHPTGPESSIKEKDQFPVVQICYTDALAYANWAGKRLPTEAQWEYAARGGQSKNTVFYWGNEMHSQGKSMANNFQGNFPNKDIGTDGFVGVAPVQSFPPNPYGIYDMEGNVWEWCNDFYRSDYYQSSPQNNPKGPGKSYNAEEPNLIERVQRGGSFICSEQYCERFKAGSRGKGEINSASNNLGFRCVSDTSPRK